MDEDIANPSHSLYALYKTGMAPNIWRYGLTPYPDTRFSTVQPAPYIPNNASIMPEDVRFRTIYHSTVGGDKSKSGIVDLTIPTNMDNVKNCAIRDFRVNRLAHKLNGTQKNFFKQVYIYMYICYIECKQLANARQDERDDIEMNRIAYKTAKILDYHDRIGGKYCHVANNPYEQQHSQHQQHQIQL